MQFLPKKSSRVHSLRIFCTWPLPKNGMERKKALSYGTFRQTNGSNRKVEAYVYECNARLIRQSAFNSHLWDLLLSNKCCVQCCWLKYWPFQTCTNVSSPYSHILFSSLEEHHLTRYFMTRWEKWKHFKKFENEKNSFFLRGIYSLRSKVGCSLA